MKTSDTTARHEPNQAAGPPWPGSHGAGCWRDWARTIFRRWRLEQRLRLGLPDSNLVDTAALKELIDRRLGGPVFGFLPANRAASAAAGFDAVKTGLVDRGALVFDLFHFQPHCHIEQTAENTYATSLCEAFCILSRRMGLPLVVGDPSRLAVLLQPHCGPLVYLVPPPDRIKGFLRRRRHGRLLRTADLLLLDSRSAPLPAELAEKPALRITEPDAIADLLARYSAGRSTRSRAREASGERIRSAGGEAVDLVSFYFYDWHGRALKLGGAERYVLDLARLLEAKAFRPRIVQNALEPFERRLEGIPVVGLPATDRSRPDRFFRYYLDRFAGADRVICSPMTLACRRTGRKVIGINHGIGWDFHRAPARLGRVARASVENCGAVVSVDTNFINWMRTVDCTLARKLVYVPNYFDPALFQPREKGFLDDQIVIAFPRRLYEARGVYLAIELVNRIAPRFENTSFLFVGQVDHEDVERRLRQIADRFPGRVTRVELPLDKMAEVYSRSQIVLVPTLQSEGTSLSCIEALATNNAVVATNVGGLPNLILHDYNGLLIPPTESDLERAVISLVTDRDKRALLARNGVASVQPLEKSRWERQWSTLIGVW